ncbi:MAG TPA: DUF1587 domain-containing protein, partial [Planctomycetota bacterium]|nr:DUF1587 domain-containing protein [Planctomycetota bacterium]
MVKAPQASGKAGRPGRVIAGRALALLALGLGTLGSCGGEAAPSLAQGSDPLEGRFASQVRPFFERYCFSCHGPQKHKADLDLTRDFNVAAIARNSKEWDLVLSRIEAREMPPEETSRQPAPDERSRAVAWLHDLGDREAKRNAGDPGLVLARRLSNAEFDNTIRDLTGVDIRPTREFPVDPANEAGFDNSGESLTMSEALLRKYLAAARLVADHLVLKPQGFVFAPHPAVTDTDRDKYGVHRIMDFYTRHRVDYADYFQAAWRFKHRDALGKTGLTLPGAALEASLSPKYLSLIWS